MAALYVFIIIGSIGAAVSIIWLGIAAFAHWYYRPKKLNKKRVYRVEKLKPLYS